MRPAVKTCIDYIPGRQNPNTYVNPHLAQEKLKMAMIRAKLVKAGCSTPIMDKEDVMDILRDNDMHPQDVPFSDFRRLRNLYVELGVLNRISNVKLRFCLSSCCTTDTSAKRERC
jgi:hypothetical protein